MTEELRPCPVPWCGSEILETISQPFARAQCVICQSCHCHGPLGKTEADAITAWNRRVPSTEVTALVEAAREAVDTLDFSITLTHEVRPDLSAEVADTNQKYQDQANAAYSKLQAALVPFNGEKP